MDNTRWSNHRSDYLGTRLTRRTVLQSAGAMGVAGVEVTEPAAVTTDPEADATVPVVDMMVEGLPPDAVFPSPL